MSQLASLPERDLLTVVLAGGCNLNCSFCAVNARRERFTGASFFTVDQYHEVVSVLAAEKCISGVAIVGDEPLLPTVWPIAKSLLATAQRSNVPSALVTNGTWLVPRCAELADHNNHILISLDGIGYRHDVSRRHIGAYACVREGIDAVIQRPLLRDRVTITSIVHPERYDDLSKMPQVLAGLGVKRWALSPLIQFRRTKPAQLHPRLFPAIYRELPKIMYLGRQAGLDVMIDDGLSLLLQADAKGELRDLEVARPKVPDIRVLRMAPDGTTVRYTDLLSTDTSRALRWDGKEDPVAFYHRLYAANPDPVAA